MVEKIKQVILALLIGIALIIMTSGCATKEFVAVPPANPPVLVRPELATDKLKQGDAADVVIRAHRLTILTLKGYIEELEQIIEGYRIK